MMFVFCTHSATPLMTEEAAWVPPGASLLVESEGFGGVIQILGSGAPRLQEQQPKPEQQRQQGSTANAIVLTTRHTRGNDWVSCRVCRSMHYVRGAMVTNDLGNTAVVLSHEVLRPCTDLIPFLTTR